MKEGNNLSYVTRIGAYGFAVVATFAVALAVLLSVSSTSVEAAVWSNATGTVLSDDGLTRNNGDTVYINNTDGSGTTYVRFEIETVGSASASFTHASADGDGQGIICNAGGTCDAQRTATGSVTVALKIDDDSGAGAIFVRSTPVSGAANPMVTFDTINVVVAQVPTTLTVKAKTGSIDAKGAGAVPPGAGTTYVDIRLTDSNGKGIESKAITVVSTRALLASVAQSTTRTITVGGVTENAALATFTGAASLAATVMTSKDANPTQTDVDSAGYARVVVTGAGSPGISTITVTMGELTGTEDIVLHGVVKTIEATVEQGAIEVGGRTRIVVTARDAGDNPVANQHANVKTKDGVTPPERLAKKVDTSNIVNKDGGTVGKLTDKGDIPACGLVPEIDAAVDVVGVAGSSGTNAAGQCVIEVSAPGGDTTSTADDAARGEHTIIVVASLSGAAGPKGVNEAEVVVQVGGAPAIIEHDGPERIDPSDELTINVTVVDDEGVRVGRVNIEVIHTAGDGAIITNIAAKTSDGRAKFTYLAPSTPGVTEFLVRTKNAAGTVVTSQEPIIIAIGVEPVVVEDPPDEPPSLSEAPSATGVTLTSFSGGTVEELKTVLTAACSGDGVSAYTTSGGAWNTFIPGAPAQLNATFSELYAAGIPEGKILLVANCGG